MKSKQYLPWKWSISQTKLAWQDYQESASESPLEFDQWLSAHIELERISHVGALGQFNPKIRALSQMLHV